MKTRSWQWLGLLALAACGSPAPTNAQEPSGSSLHANVPATSPPFTTAAVATFDSPWALDFLPGSTVALVTEKGGRLWLVDVANGQKQEVSGAPKVVAKGQGGLLDVKVSPHFAEDNFVYLTFSEPSQNGGSQLALARGKLVRGASPALQGLTVIWRNPTGGQGGHFGARVAFAPDGNCEVPEQRPDPATVEFSLKGSFLTLRNALLVALFAWSVVRLARVRTRAVLPARPAAADAGASTAR